MLTLSPNMASTIKTSRQLGAIPNARPTSLASGLCSVNKTYMKRAILRLALILESSSQEAWWLILQTLFNQSNVAKWACFFRVNSSRTVDSNTELSVNMGNSPTISVILPNGLIETRKYIDSIKQTAINVSTAFSRRPQRLSPPG